MTKKKIQKLSIRLLKERVEPREAMREDVELEEWAELDGAMIALGTMGGKAPKWSNFLELTEEEKKKVRNSTAYGLVFLKKSNRWFAVSFGMGHVKLDPAKFERDFGLRVVLNSVDPTQIKSADVKTPDENTLSRRSQTSRGSDQTAFGIDVEKDIIRGLAGIPKDDSFAVRVAGSDALSIDRRLNLNELPDVCADTLDMYNREDYKENFRWVDNVKYVREGEVINSLDESAAKRLKEVLDGADQDDIHLAFPIIYDPERTTYIRYKGFRSKKVFPNLELSNYIEALKEKGITDLTPDDLKKHTVHEVDEDGRDCGKKWKVYECLVLEMEMDGHIYVLSEGKWYQVDKDYAEELLKFFEDLPKENLPDALPEENEQRYNERLKNDVAELLCLDRKLFQPTGWNTTMEFCDFLDRGKRIIHVKYKTSSSRLSHLFNQGIVSGRLLKVDKALRDQIVEKVSLIEEKEEKSGFKNIIPPSNENFSPSDFTIVYGVIVKSNKRKLPFFSLVTLRQAAQELDALGYKVAFVWINKRVDTTDLDKETV